MIGSRLMVPFNVARVSPIYARTDCVFCRVKTGPNPSGVDAFAWAGTLWKENDGPGGSNAKKDRAKIHWAITRFSEYQRWVCVTRGMAQKKSPSPMAFEWSSADEWLFGWSCGMMSGLFLKSIGFGNGKRGFRWFLFFFIIEKILLSDVCLPAVKGCSKLLMVRLSMLIRFLLSN